MKRLNHEESLQMPEYLISDQGEFPKYARVALNKSVAWSNSDGATTWPSEQKAWADFESACVAMELSAKAKLAAAVKKNLIKDNKAGAGYWGARYSMGSKSADTLLLLFATQWFANGWVNASGAERERNFGVVSRPGADDLLSVFDTYYVRDDRGLWLGSPKTRAHHHALQWHANFAQASAFVSEGLARTAAEANRVGGFNIMKTSCVFTSVLPGKSGLGQPIFVDDVAAGIAAACEARDIRASMAAEVDARMSASAVQERPVAKKKSARL